MALSDTCTDRGAPGEMLLSLWAVGPGPKESGRWFANFTDRGTGGHVPLGSSMGLGPFGMLEDLVRQLEGPDHALRQRVKKRGPIKDTPGAKAKSDSN